MIHDAYVFRNDGAIGGFFDVFLGGLFLVQGAPLAGQLLFFVASSLAVMLAGAETATGGRRWGRAADVAAILAFTLFCLFCLQPWDELFVNLRHARHFAESNTFSFNRAEPIEGTVDFAPYLLLGVLAKLGLPLLEMAFLQCWIGGLLCLWIVRRLLIAWGFGAWRTWATVGLALYPPLAFNASHGFATTLFAANALGALTALFFSRRRSLGWCLLAALPLVRPEGLWLTWLATGLRLRRDRAPWPRAAAMLVLVSAPLALLSAWRAWYFGSPVPTPVEYKASAGRLFYLVLGFRNLIADLAASGTWIALLAIAAALVLFRHRGERLPPWLREALGPLVVLIAFILPYYPSGGDWFPFYWARYLFPLAIYAVPLAVAAYLTALPRAWRTAGVALAVVLVALQALWPMSSMAKGIEGLFTHRRMLAKLYETKTGRGHYRIQHLSQLGNHLRRTTTPDEVIGSSEIATLMYFADREALDLLGVANRTIARSPLRWTPPLWRPFPRGNELPPLIFKRVRPDEVERKRPAIVYTFDLILRDQLEGVPFEEVRERDLFVALRRWERKMGGLIGPLYGGVDRLLALGYAPVVVFYANEFSGLYFVSATSLPGHLKRLKDAGFRGGRVEAAAVGVDW